VMHRNSWPLLALATVVASACDGDDTDERDVVTTGDPARQ